MVVAATAAAAAAAAAAAVVVATVAVVAVVAAAVVVVALAVALSSQRLSFEEESHPFQWCIARRTKGRPTQNDLTLTVAALRSAR